VVNVARRIFITVSALLILLIQARAETIKWVNFDVPYESLQCAMEADIDSFEKGNHISWIDILAVSACRTGGKCGLQSVKRSLTELRNGKAPEEILGGLYKYFDYYQKAYKAVLGGLLGIYSVVINGQERVTYGLKAFSPIAAGYGYSHCADFGNERSFGFTRKHLGNDIMGSLGTPIVAVEGGVIEVMGWNRYGGWRIGIRSFDGMRYYYYAHLRKDTPFAEGLQEGHTVKAGQTIGYVGQTGYSFKENVNNIQVPHLHFGIQLIFNEVQKDGNNQIWIDCYQIAKLLSNPPAPVIVETTVEP
jgi:murein DD-endopeptidase MepM/ murein hydrolase activator NlpD